MIRDIKKKMVILSGRMPFSTDVKDFITQIEKKEWVYRNMKLEGSALTQEQADSLIKGQYVLGASVWEHIMTERLTKVLSKMHDMNSRGTDMDLKLINSFHNIIAGVNKTLKDGYRKRSAVITEFEYIPVLPAEIPQKMEELSLFISRSSRAPAGSAECFERAVQIHNKIISILPFGDEDKLLARIAAAYFLMTKGYPAIVADVGEGEYNGMVYDSLKSGENTALSSAVLKALRQRFDLMIQLTAY